MMFARAELVEGALLSYRGCAWIVKGVVHPPNSVVAIPRYRGCGSSWRRLTKAEQLALIKDFSRWWNFIKMSVPQIPRSRIHLIKPSLRDPRLEYVYKFLRTYVHTSALVTGSSAVGIEDAHDLDVVFVCKTLDEASAVYNRLRLIAETLPIHASKGFEYIEWLDKHRHEIDFRDYAYAKSRSVLYGMLFGVPYSARIVCLELKPSKVMAFKNVEDVIEIRKPLHPYTTPCRYIAYSKSLNKVLLESYRLLFTELPRGMRIKAFFRIELREDGFVYAVPDHSEYVVIT